MKTFKLTVLATLCVIPALLMFGAEFFKKPPPADLVERGKYLVIRTGRHMSAGRPILPPMPWQNLAALHDDDLKAIYAYLRTIPAIRNQVPEPASPDARGSFE